MMRIHFGNGPFTLAAKAFKSAQSTSSENGRLYYMAFGLEKMSQALDVDRLESTTRLGKIEERLQQIEVRQTKSPLSNP